MFDSDILDSGELNSGAIALRDIWAGDAQSVRVAVRVGNRFSVSCFEDRSDTSQSIMKYLFTTYP
jgi:hypothetical protein